MTTESENFKSFSTLKEVNIILELAEDPKKSTYFIANRSKIDLQVQNFRLKSKFECNTIGWNNSSPQYEINVFLSGQQGVADEKSDVKFEVEYLFEPFDQADNNEPQIDVLLEPEEVKTEPLDISESIAIGSLSGEESEESGSDYDDDDNEESNPTQPKRTRRKGVNSNEINIPEENIIYTKSKVIPKTPQDFEKLYLKRRSSDKCLPYTEIMMLGDESLLYFRKVSEKTCFYMTCFDQRKLVCDICCKQFKNIRNLMYDRNSHFIQQRSNRTKCSACGVNFDTREIFLRHSHVCRERRNVIPVEVKTQAIRMMAEQEREEKQKFLEAFESRKKLAPTEVRNDEESTKRPDKKTASAKMRQKTVERAKKVRANFAEFAFAEDKTIRTKTNRILTTTKDYEKIYWEKRRKPGRPMPYFEIVELGDGSYLYFMKHTRKGIFHMTGFDVRPLQCDICAATYKDTITLFKHRNIHFVDRGQTKCAACKIDFGDRDVVLRHIMVCKEKHVLSPDKCKYCGEQFNSYPHLRAHEISHFPELVPQGQQQQMCEICSMVFDNSEKLRYHLRRKHAIGAFECHHCHKNRYADRSEILRHLVRKHFPSIAPYTCDACGEPFTTPSTLRAHFKVNHAKENQVKCKECEKIMPKGSLPNHIERFHKNFSERKKFFCRTCGKIFFNQKGLQEHEMTHVDRETWPYTCEVCGRRLPSLQRYQCHVKQHTKPPPTCSICQKTFHSNTYLQEHMNLHTGARPFLCKVCGKGFTDRGRLRSHLKNHESSTGMKLLLTKEEARMKRLGLLETDEQSEQINPDFNVKSN